jgi:hypothetical protein
MKRRTVKLPDDLDALVREEALRRGMSLSLWLREAVASHVPTIDLRATESVGEVGRAGERAAHV